MPHSGSEISNILPVVRGFEDEREIRNLLAAIVESSEDAIISKNLDGIILSWNKGAERMFGHDSTEAIGQHISLIIPTERFDEEVEIIRKLKAGERIEHFETVRVRKDGSELPISITVSPVRDYMGRVIGASKVARDISDRIQTEEILRQEARSKDEFLAVLAHELRNPLAPIRNAVELLHLKPAVTPEDEWALGVMDRQIEHMTRLIDDLLDVARINSNKLELRIERVNLNEVAALAIETSRPAMDVAGQTISTLLPTRPLYLNGDRVRLAQIISNLLNNAGKYTPGGGHIELEITKSRGKALIQVRDKGNGIPREMLPNIFNMFTQAPAHEERVKSGLGIGLTLVKELTELHGGAVSVVSEVGKGSAFTISLPLLDTAEEREDMTPQADRLSSDLRVLIVDDNKDATESLTMLLASQGCAVEYCFDGFEAYERAETFKPHAILLDIGMPKIDGLELAKMIRRQPWGEHITLIATTGLGQEADKHRSQAAGFDYHFVKPVNFTALKQLLMSITPEDSDPK